MDTETREKAELLVCSVESSEKLKALGVPQESLFNWYRKWLGSSDEDAGEYFLVVGTPGIVQSSKQEFSAFTATELGKWAFPMMSAMSSDARLPRDLELKNGDEIFDPEFWAKMLIFIVENKLAPLSLLA